MGFTQFTPDENGFRFSNNKFSPPLWRARRNHKGLNSLNFFSNQALRKE